MKSKRSWYRSLAAIGIVGLVLQLLAPFGVEIGRAAATASATNITASPQSTSADISLYIMNGGYYKVEYGLASSYGSISSQGYVTSTPWGPVGVTLTGLTPNTTYNYRVKAWPLSIPSPTESDITYSSNYTFTTTAPPDTTAPSVTSVSAMSITTTDVTINFIVNETGTAKVEYGPNDSYSNSSSEMPASANTQASITLTGLTAGTAYNYRIVARDQANNSGNSDSSTFTTLAPADTTPPSVSGVSASSLTANSASINFTLSEVANVKIEYGLSGALNLSTTEASFPITPMSIALSGLTANTIYSYRVAARDAAGNIGYSSTSTFTTTTSGGASTTSCTGITLTLTKSTYTLGENVNYTYACTPSGTRAEYIGIMLIKPDQSSTTYNYATNIDASAMGFSTSNLSAGSYTLRACFNSSCSPSPTASASFTITSAATTPGAGAPEPSSNDAGVWAQVDTATGQLAGSAICTRSVCGLNGEWHGYVPPSSYATGSVWWPTSKRYIWQMPGQAGYGSGTFNFSTYVFTVSGGTIYNGVFTPTPTSTPTPTPSSSSLIGHWKFDGNGNNDVAGGPGAVSVGGASFYASGGKLGGYAYIPSSSDYIRIPYSSSFDLPNAFTVEFWFRQRSNQSFNQNLVSKGTPSNNYNFNIFRYLWNQYNSGAVITGYTAASTGYWTQTSNPNEPAHNVWHHVAFVKDSARRAYYIDGVEIHSATDSPAAKTPASDIMIGNPAPDTDIDNLKIYNYALSASEVQNSGPFSSTSTDTTAPAVSGVWSSGVTANSANVYFTLNEAGYAKVEYGPNNTFNLSTSELSVAASVSSTIYLSGLSSGTAYSYRVAARDSANNSAASGSYWFTTTSSSNTATTTPPIATSTPPITGTAGIRITVKDTTGAVVSGANISVSNAQSGGYSWSSGYTGADGAYTATNLAAGSFNIGVSAPSSRTDLGYISSYPVSLVSGATISTEITLPRSTATPTPTNDTTAPIISGVHIMDNTSSRTQVMWGTDDQSYGQVEYGETTAYGKSTSWSTTSSYSPTIDITGLTVGKLYHYRARAKNQAGLETTSGDYTFIAGSSTTPTPTIFTVEPARSYPQSGASEVPLSNLKIHIEFSKPVDSSSVTGGAVYLGFLGSTAASLSGSLDVFSNGFNFIPSSPLKAGATYNLTVRGTIRASTGEPMGSDHTLSFTTAKEGTVAGQGTIKGTVKDGSGQPVANAYVSLRAGGAYATYTSGYYGGGSSSGFGYNQTIQTTTYGEYSFTNLAPGTYTIEVYPPSGGGGVDRPAPQVVAIAANETVTRDFAFASSGRFIKGTVKFSDGSPVTDAEVSAYKREGGGWVSSPTGESGAYTLAVGSGSWMVSIRPRYAPAPYATAYAPGTIAYTPPPAPPTPNWVYTNPPQEVYIDTESKVVDFLVPRQSSSTSVSGTLERADGEPLSDGIATVRFIGQGGFSVSTAASSGGRFSTPINPGGYKVYVDLTDSNLSSPDFPPISVSPGEQKDIGAIRLYGASASISGRVTTPDGKGIPRVKVGGWKMNSSDNSSASTDEKGEYVFKVSSGEWTVGIMPTPDQPYTTTAPPQVVRVKGGRVSGINFVLAQSDGIVNGVVTDESGNILSDFYGFVRVGSKGGSRLPAGAPVERGQFTLRLPAGNYMLYMELPPNAGYGWPAPVAITVATGESVKVAMKMAASASSAVIGYLVDSAGNKITNAPFKVFASGEGGGWYSAITDEAIGYYKLKLPAGTWFIGYELAGEENSYERIGGRKKKVSLAAGEIVSLDLEAVHSSGKITGVIRDDGGNGVANVWIAIASSQFGTFSRVSAASWRYLNGVNSDEKGNFTLNVPPGIYFVRAFVPPSMNFINPEEQKVRVAAGEEETVELILRARETTISGKTTIAGIPNWAFVWAWSDTGGYTESAADDSGNYKLKVSSSDIWHVAAMAEIKRETFKASEVELVITRPGNYPLSLDLSPLGVKLPEPVTVSTEADQMTVAENTAGSKLVVPANAAGTEGALNVSITPQVLTPSQGADRVIGFGYEMEVRTPTGREINTFNSELTVSIPYDPLELGRLNLAPADLTLRFWDETSSTWQMIQNAVVDETNHVVTGSVAHLTRFALVAATDTEPPFAPSQVKAKVAGDGVVVTWQKPKDKDLRYVKIYRSAKAGLLGEVVANNLTAAAYKDSGMARGATYYYLVRAVDAAGNESVNTAAVTAKITGKGTLGKKVARAAAIVKEKQKVEGAITDINLAASTLEIKNKAGKKVIVSFSPTLTIEKDGKKVLVSTLKAGNTITAEAGKEGTALTLVSAKAGSVKVKIKGKVKGAATVGAKSKLKLSVKSVEGKVAGATIKSGQETNAVIQGGYLLQNGRAVPVEYLLTQGDVIVEGVLEDGGVTVTRITTGK